MNIQLTLVTGLALMEQVLNKLFHFMHLNDAHFVRIECKTEDTEALKYIYSTVKC